MKCVINGGNPEFRVGNSCTATTPKEAAQCCATAGQTVHPQEVLFAYEDAKKNPPLLGSVVVGLLSAIHHLEERLGIYILD